ncbi:MAG: hypothetical protein L6R40_002174 [Gallowayella cf. fulva]|nr:MAG: hypothetical protein L6R40_002174 [Xanthomendoza cf. fulva]
MARTTVVGKRRDDTNTQIDSSSIWSRKRDLCYLVVRDLQATISLSIARQTRRGGYIVKKVLTNNDSFSSSIYPSCSVSLPLSSPPNSPSLIDLPALYPPFLTHPALTDLRTYYHTTYKDQFFSPAGPPTAWFAVFLWMEALYHVPLSVWAVRALYNAVFMGVDMFGRLQDRLMPV